MSVIRVGSTGTYAEGWESIFGGGKGAARPKASAPKKAAPKKAVKKKAAAQRKKKSKRKS
jgi:hypothetical protein